MAGPIIVTDMDGTLSTAVAIVFGVLLFAHVRSPEYMAARTIVMATRPTIQTAVESAGSLLIFGGSAIAVVVIVLGVARELEAALYFTVVVLLLVVAAWTLLWLVFMERRPETASDPAALPATGGPSA
jgi:Mn2+/Fe2+ NRAMP family transporter